MSQETEHGPTQAAEAQRPGLLARLAGRFRRAGRDERPYDPDLDVDLHLGLTDSGMPQEGEDDGHADSEGPEDETGPAEGDVTEPAPAVRRTWVDMLLRRGTAQAQAQAQAAAADDAEAVPPEFPEAAMGEGDPDGGAPAPAEEAASEGADPRAAIAGMLRFRAGAEATEASVADAVPDSGPDETIDEERARIVALIAARPQDGGNGGGDGPEYDGVDAEDGDADVIVALADDAPVSTAGVAVEEGSGHEAGPGEGGHASVSEATQEGRPVPASPDDGGFLEDEDTSRAIVLRADGTRLPRHRLGEYVLNKGLITPEALDAASREQEVTGKRIGQILVSNGFLTDKDRVEAILDTASERIAQESVARTRIPVDLLDEYNIQVSAETEDCIYVSTMGDEETVRRVVEEYYGDKRIEFVSFQPTSMNAFIGSMKKTASTEDTGQSSETMLDRMIFQALSDGASDIHLMPRRESYTAMFRMLGVRRIVREGTLDEYKTVIAQVKDRARMDLAERRKPQDGGFQIEYAGKMIDLRVATLPTAEGETCVLRVLDPDRVQPSLEQLGITRLDRWRKGYSQQNGLCLICGPTGSGKTTTLNSSIKEMDRFGKSIYTIEDPVEYRVPYVGQVSVNSSVGLNFPAAVRAFMRADPDVIVLGEVRDEETARNALKAADTGHLVLATLHTGSILGAVSRLRDLGVDPRELRYLLRAVLVQTLVRTTCGKCGGAGCASCGGTGYAGRTIVSECEYFEDYDAVDRLLKATGESEVKRTWPTMIEDAVAKMRAGVTDRRELDRVFGAAVEMHVREGE